MWEEEDKLYSIKQKCKKHHSDIGGLCDEITCQTKNQMKCIKCISENEFCIRKYKHHFVTIKEFFDKIFEQDYEDLKTNFNTSKQVNITENYCANTDLLLKTFAVKRKELLTKFESLYDDILKHLNQVHNEFIAFYTQMMDNKENELKEYLLSLNLLINYDALNSFDKEELKSKMAKMPYEVLDKTFLQMKKTIDNLNLKKHVDINKKINIITTMHDDKIKESLEKEFLSIYSQISQTFSSMQNELANDLFKEEIREVEKITTLKKIYDKTIDFSYNSIFLDKKFTIFKSIITKDTILAYPSTLNQIKLEVFNNNIKSLEEQFTVTSNEVLHADFNVNSRDNYLFFKLCGHKTKITNIKYTTNQPYNNSEYLISSSDDHTIKIWNITNIADYINKPNQYYIDNNVKSLIGHKDKISFIEIFYDPSSTMNFVISGAKNEKIKVWDIDGGGHMRDIFDRESEFKGTFEDYAKCYTVTDKNYMITYNNEYHIIKIWNFDSAKVLYIIKYNSLYVMKDILYAANINKVIILDANGTCTMITVRENKEPQVVDMNLNTNNTERNGAVFIEDNIIIIYNKNGILYQYDLNERRIIDKMRISFQEISHCEKYYDDDNNRNVLLSHCSDQTLKIFGKI